MALTVNTNLAALSGLRNLNQTNRSLNSSFQHISSGLRITKAADDAAGLAVAENLDSAVQSLRQARRNTNDGISIVQTAEGATNEVSNIIKRLRELAVEASSETLNSTERSYIATEYNAMLSEVDRIANVTEFNGVKLGNTGGVSMDVQVGMRNTINDRIGIEFGDMRATEGLSLGAAGTGWSAANFQGQLSSLDGALDRLNTTRAKFGSVQNRLTNALNNLEVYTENLQAAESQIRDADFAFETAEMAKFQIMQQAGTAVLAQANQINQGAVRLLG
jgi:flagellin